MHVFTSSTLSAASGEAYLVVACNLFFQFSCRRSINCCGGI
uniref:Uncharacterized protein n=1 Tax=Arundo donax TaxID=35708 RepID=A0A0A9BZH5_ARUDO